MFCISSSLLFDFSKDFLILEEMPSSTSTYLSRLSSVIILYFKYLNSSISMFLFFNNSYTFCGTLFFISCLFCNLFLMYDADITSSFDVMSWKSFVLFILNISIFKLFFNISFI